MATFEVATQVQDLADVMVASRNSSQDTVGTSPPEILRDRRDVGAAGLAVEFIDTYAAQAAEAGMSASISRFLRSISPRLPLEEALDELRTSSLRQTLRDRGVRRCPPGFLEFGANPDPSLATNLLISAR